MEILGIVNITRDSFSDGGRFFEPQAAIAHALRLTNDGADIIDLGAESTHPAAEDVPADEQIARLTPVIQALCANRIRVSVDTYRPEVMRAALALGAEIINDVTALRDPAAVALLRAAPQRIILMHSVSVGARAELGHKIPPETIVPRILKFFEQRIGELAAAGIAPERLILDPGMGLFLGSDRELSLAVLRGLPELARLGRPVCISTSRKSFIGAVLGGSGPLRPPAERGAGTLATELWAAQAGAAYIRTHDVRALRDAWTLWQSIRAGSVGPPWPT